eukprot:CAMPEP_0201509038 /NCGR_PEP_ID=MMETSP0161_2-20130828/2205_1 /ASSEMBLY_ACC=CAM_ASM_000251 /TAXON_ID=180227 /ORGANISM="Neoparamoeba aestuarina, Strain SoJaBio B1-5/56/2" /LENGTH=188 /DNA_ID=CAMNT_0047903871 /DNA_START=293 /DNA_END=859 /DNA_ORIENTATION=-
MFSGKTTELLRRVKRYSVANRNCLVLKYHKDIRHGAEQEDEQTTSQKRLQTATMTHDRQTHQALPCSSLFQATQQIKDGGYDVVAIDEGQFFPDVYDFCEQMANEGKTVIVAALSSTFQRKPFGDIPLLTASADTIDHLTAVCMLCCEPAPFSLRTTKETEVEVIGGQDKYISVCRQCYLEQSNDESG